MVTELGSLVSESSTRFSKFYAATNSELKFHKTGSKIGYPYDSDWDYLDWEPAVITITLCSTTNRKNLKILYTHP